MTEVITQKKKTKKVNKADKLDMSVSYSGREMVETLSGIWGCSKSDALDRLIMEASGRYHNLVFPDLKEPGVSYEAKMPTLSRYKIIEKINDDVFLAEDFRFNRKVAVKFTNVCDYDFKFGKKISGQLQADIFRGAITAAMVTHRNVVKVYDIGIENDLAYAVFEYIEGSSLGQFITCDKLLPMTDVVKHIISISEALSCLNENYIVHTDVYSDNIILTKEGDVKLVDFDLSKILHEDDHVGLAFNSTLYSAPERFISSPDRRYITHQSDIFSLGVTLYELLTGCHPFLNGSRDLPYSIQYLKHKDPRDYNPDIPESLVDVIDLALKKDKKYRYKDAFFMALDLRLVLETMSK